MKLAIVLERHAPALEGLYLEKPELSRLTYSEQHTAICNQYFDWSNSYSIQLNSLHYECNEFFANVGPLQNTWAVENLNRIRIGRNWIPSILIEQLIAFRPEVALVDYTILNAQEIGQLRARCPSLKLLIGWCGGPVTNIKALCAFDLVLSCAASMVEKFRASGLKAEHLHHAFDPRVLADLGPIQDPPIDLSFVGNIFRSPGFHQDREKLLLGLAKALPLEIYSEAANLRLQDIAKFSAKVLAYSSGTLIKKLGLLGLFPALHRFHSKGQPVFPVHPLLYFQLKPAVYGREMYNILRRSKISLNRHIQIAGPSAANLRLFEATGVGSCLLTDAKSDLHTLFKVDSEIVTYDSTEDCVEKVEWLLCNPSKRHEIAIAGQNRTLRTHTFKQRAKELDYIIRQHLGK